MTKLISTISTLAICCFSGNSKQQLNNESKGICIVSIYAKSHNDSKLSKIVPDDSIFYSGRTGLEKIIGIKRDEQANSTLESYSIKQYNLVKFDSNCFYNLDKLSDLTKLSIADCLPLNKKQYGLDLSVSYHKNEKIQLSYSKVNGITTEIISFDTKEKLGNSDELHVKYRIHILKNVSENIPKLVPNIENTRRGRVIRVEISYPYGKEMVIATKYAPNGKQQEFDYLQLANQMIANKKI